MSYARRNLKWNGWGAVDRSFDLHGREQDLYAFLAAELGVAALPTTPSCRWEDIELPAGRIEAHVLDELRGAIGAEHVCVDAYERVFHAVGRSYFDLLRLRTGRIPGTPDAVVYPASTEDVVAILRIARGARLAVIPFGGGSSVVGGVEAVAPAHAAGVVTLDTSRMNRLLELDAVSRTARLQGGIYGPELERVLQERGYTLGHYPQSFEYSTLGGWIAARGSGQQSARYGGAERWLIAANLVTPTGHFRTSAIPRSAAGPGLNQVVTGSEGALGVIVDATVRITPKPPQVEYRGALMPSFDAGAAVIRDLQQAGIPVAMLRLSDTDETRFYSKFAQMGKKGGATKALVKRLLALRGLEAPCLLLMGFEGEPEMVDLGRKHARTAVLRHGGVPVGRGPGKNWYKGRFEMPLLRDPLMDHGVGVDTLETSAEWAKLARVHTAVRQAIAATLRQQGVGGFVMAHISHSYTDGASLYFTFVFARQLDREVEQWRELKRAASEAIVREGSTISHHHGVGLDHRPWLQPELGDAGIELLRAMRRSVDPDGIMNPGKLVD